MSQSEHTTALLNEIGKQSNVGPGVEPETAAMFGGFVMAYQAEANFALDQPRPITQFLEEVANEQMGEGGKLAPATASVLRTSLVNYMIDDSLEQGGRRFSDKGLCAPSQYANQFNILRTALAEQQSLAVMRLGYNAVYGDAKTSAIGRAASIDIMLQLAKDRWPDGCRALEIGSSLMTIPLQLTYKPLFKQRLHSVMYQEHHGAQPKKLTGKSHAILEQPSAVDSFVANDKYPIYYNSKGETEEEHKQYDPGSVEFALSGLRPSERNDPKYMHEIRSMLNIKQRGSLSYDKEEKVKFWWGDLLEEAQFEKFKADHPGEFDVIIMSFMTQELPPEDQLKIHYLAMQLLSANGLLIYNHQAYIDPFYGNGPAPIETVTHYSSYANQPYRSQMHFVDNLLEAARGQVQHAMTFKDNRCQEVRLAGGRIMVNGAPEPLIDVITNMTPRRLT